MAADLFPIIIYYFDFWRRTCLLRTDLEGKVTIASVKIGGLASELCGFTVRTGLPQSCSGHYLQTVV